MSGRSLHLIIISYPSRLDAHLEEIARKVARGVSEARVVERAQRSSDLRFLIRRWHLRDRDVRTVDLVGHGSAGRFKLGDEILFDSDGRGLEVIEELTPWLSPRASLRLLGCDVANHARRPQGTWDGSALLAKLAGRLGAGRRVLAPTGPLYSSDYDDHGLTRRARACLTSSTTPRRPHGSRA